MSKSKHGKRFNPEYKKEMVKLVEELGQSPVEVGTSIDVSPQTIRNWIKQYGAGGDEEFPGKGNLHPADKEKAKMKKHIKDLEEENAILKKAMAIFAKDGK